ncbi:small ribosomal subunit protein uS3m [Desmodus rotundus]|uniref:small ribosomal subunit protein uS3m n=1 Tax=Desmodus rotundus TaxID=9430 RepID=UPI0023817514|nr:28S ribosomal protein S24, mitochondrial [Desmodus rotundus]
MTGPGGRSAEIRVSGAAPATRMLPALRPRPEAYPPPSDSHSRSGFDLGSSAVRLPVADLRPAASRYVTGCAQPKMAALLCSPGLGPRVLSWSRVLPCAWRALHISAACAKNRAARVRVGKGDKPVTYEEAHAPHHIAHRKGWLSLHTGNLDGQDHAAERTVEDVFLRKFMLGTFPGCLADQLVLKRRANQVEICALVLRQLPAHKFYFLVGYSETLLSHFYKCPVRVHLQTVPSKAVYKYI